MIARVGLAAVCGAGGQDVITLRGITWDHPRGRQPLEETADFYADRFGVRVEWSARSLKDFGDAPIDALAERYDIIILDHPHVGIALTGRRPLLPLDTYIDPADLQTLAGQSAGPSHESYMLAGHQWALGNDGAMQAGSRRTDLGSFDWPGDWESVMALGTELTKGVSRLAIPLAPTDAVCSFISLCAGRDGMNEPARCFVKHDVGLWALGVLQRLLEVCHPQSPHWNPIAMYEHMSTHDDVAYCPLAFCYTNYSRTGFRPRQIAFGPVPQPRGSVLGGAGLGVSARCRHPREACNYGLWLCSAAVQRGLYVRHGGQPGNIEAWRDDAADEVTGGFFSGTRQVIENAFVRPRHVGWPAFQEWAGNTIRSTLLSRSDHAACLRAVESRYQQSLDAVEP
ncbi:MAG: carbohydrate ABC transporter substrate-binding protein [Leptolyngbya sp. PLA3]|nr:MAG: carbohydrate ABC transporter substrate-binding protein [Cyanobacteria bacterium CYA]MCE7968278.1 carbohydrate ABC transporter substrate-binding protein [Leptolyngbya sp. PL-A3]